MASSQAVVARMENQVNELIDGFDEFLKIFAMSERFTGPSWYFHRKTLSLRSRHSSVASLVQDDDFFDSLYATLTAWGLHRMGPGNTKLRDLKEIKASIFETREYLEILVGRSLTDVLPADRKGVRAQVWHVLTRLRVSVAAVQIVANSKALHHILPSLMPPIDRQYTYKFFYGRNMLSISEQTAFEEMFERFLYIAEAKKERIESALDERWNTSVSKVIDNAIVGFMIAREGSPSLNRSNDR